MANLIRRMIRSTGFDVVRVAATPLWRRRNRPEPSPSGPGEGREFFPQDVRPEGFSLWPVPADLALRTEPWARVLAELYTRPASWPACVSPEVGMFIHALVRNLRPRVVVETGTCHGASTIWIAAAMRLAGGEGTDAGVVHTFDTFEPPGDPWRANLPLYIDRQEKVRKRLERCGFGEMVRIHVGDSAAKLEGLRAELDSAGGVQLAFIDGDHTREGVIRDLRAVEPSLNVGGYILLHDVFPAVCSYTGPRWLADNINEVGRGRYEKCDVYTAPLNYGMTVVRRVG